MANESDNFDALRKLLALKRHEVPPPGYFDRLPREIHVRLAAARPVHTRREQRASSEPRSWLANLLRLVETRPSFLGALGAAVCGLILAGIGALHRSEPSPTSSLPELVQTPVLPQTAIDPQGLVARNLLLASTNPVLPRPPSSMLFDGSWLKAEPAAFPPPAR